MKRGVAIAVVAIIGLSMIGVGQMSSYGDDSKKSWYGNFWGKDNGWYKSFWKNFDYKKFTGFLNNGGFGDDDDDDDDNHDNGVHDDVDQSPIDHAKISFNIGTRILDYEGNQAKQNIVDECIFSSEQSFDPVCIKCKFLNENQEIVAKGQKIELDKSYTANTEIPILMSSVPEAEDGYPVNNDVRNVHSVKLSICGFKCVPFFADFRNLDHGAQLDEINDVLEPKGIEISGESNYNIDELDTVIIFDADETNTADPDLEVNHGWHLLILPEKNSLKDNLAPFGYIDSPNDSAKGGKITIKMDTPYFLKSFVLVDLENNDYSYARAYDAKEGGNLVEEVKPLPETNNGGDTTVFMNAANVQRLEVFYKDSGAITNIDLKCEPPKGGKGCTPGFWKQKQHFAFWEDYDQDDKFASTFDITGSYGDLKIKVGHDEIKLKDATLLEALKAKGGGLNALARHGVAALLNAASLNYAFSVDEVKTMVKEAIENSSYESTKNTLEKENEKGCPFGNDDKECDCEERKDKHDAYYEEHKEYYEDNKRKFSRTDYKKYMDDHQQYLDDNGKYMDKKTYKKHIDYFEDFLDDNKRKFRSIDYKKFSAYHKLFSHDYKDHQDKCKCGDDRDDKDDHDKDDYDKDDYDKDDRDKKKDKDDRDKKKDKDDKDDRDKDDDDRPRYVSWWRWN